MSAQPNRSLADGLRCLQELALSEGPVGSRELARRLGWHPVRTNRLLQGLAAAGMARQDGQRRYLAGPALHVLAGTATFGSGLLGRALPYLQELGRRCAATVALGVRWQDRVCYLYHGRPDTDPAEALGRTRLHPVADSSIGLVLLAREDDATIEALVGAAGLRRCQTARRRGHARLRHGPPQHPHLNLAVVVGEPAIAGLACTGLALEVDERAVIAALHDTAAAIAAPGAPA